MDDDEDHPRNQKFHIDVIVFGFEKDVKDEHP
jgi:hypothetical protein